MIWTKICSEDNWSHRSYIVFILDRLKYSAELLTPSKSIKNAADKSELFYVENFLN
jgi:hypothetical protein